MFQQHPFILKTVVPESPVGSADICLIPLDQGMKAARFQAVSESATSLNERFSWCSLPYSREKNKHYIQHAERALLDNRGLYFAVYQAHTKRFLGEIGIDWISPDSQRLNLVFWIRDSERNKGYATGALRLLLDMIGRHLPVCYAHLVMETDNYASRRVAQKTGSLYSHMLKNGATHKLFPADTYCFKYKFYKNSTP